MKKLSKLKLVQLEENELTSRKMKQIKGGKYCTCGCCDHLPGYSGTVDNSSTNCDNNLTTYCTSGPNYGAMSCE